MPDRISHRFADRQQHIAYPTILKPCLTGDLSNPMPGLTTANRIAGQAKDINSTRLHGPVAGLIDAVFFFTEKFVEGVLGEAFTNLAVYSAEMEATGAL